LLRRAGKYYIADDGSKNRTFVNSVSVVDPVPLETDDIVTLGRSTRLPWPLPENCAGLELRIISIGRSPGNDVVIDDRTVSKYHAQLVFSGNRVEVQDLDSENGISVGRLNNRVPRCVLESHLQVYFGSRRVLAEDLIRWANAGPSAVDLADPSVV
jgi:pSer/pThr/pTyr-binding forkhead associated (FHA) protein